MSVKMNSTIKKDRRRKKDESKILSVLWYAYGQ